MAANTFPFRKPQRFMAFAPIITYILALIILPSHRKELQNKDIIPDKLACWQNRMGSWSSSRLQRNYNLFLMVNFCEIIFVILNNQKKWQLWRFGFIINQSSVSYANGFSDRGWHTKCVYNFDLAIATWSRECNWFHSINTNSDLLSNKFSIL